MNKISGERDFDNHSYKNVDPTFNLQSIVLRFTETELLDFMICVLDVYTFQSLCMCSYEYFSSESSLIFYL